MKTKRKFSPLSIGLMVFGVIFLVMTILVNTDTPLRDNVWLRVLFDTSTLNFTVRASIPLILGALCGILCERTGIVNIGIEGMMLAGAFAAFVAKVATNGWPLMLSLLFGVAIALLVGGLMGLLHATLSIRYRTRRRLGLAIVLVILLVRPYGLFGTRQIERL